MTGSRFPHALALAGLILSPPSAPAAPPADATAPAADPDRLVRDLASPVFTVRQKATRELWRLGDKARPALQAAAASDDPEVAQRAGDILAKFNWGVLPDTPPAVLAQIAEFRTGDLARMKAAVTALVGVGRPAVPTLRALLGKNLPADHRGPLFDHLCGLLRREVPRLIVAGRADDAEPLLALTAAGPSGQGVGDYAVFLHLRGRAGAVAGELEAAYKADPSPAAARALVFARRAAGHTDRAVALAAELAAKDAGFVAAYESLLEDAGRWAELPDRTDGFPVNSRDGLKAFRLQLAGKTREADALLDAARDAGLDERGRGTIDEATLALLLAGRPLDGIDRMKANRHLPHILADVLAARLEFKPALDLLGAGPAARAADAADPDADAPYLRQLYGTRRGKLLAQLGHKDAAAQVFNTLADQLLDSRDDYALVQLLRAEVRAHRADLACEHAGRALAAAERDGNRVFGNRQDAFEAVFEGDSEAAQYWWRVLRRAKPADEPPGTTLRKVRALLVGKATPDDLDRAVRAAAADPAPAPPGSPDGYGKALGLAAAYRAAGRPADAVDVLAAEADRLAAPADAAAQADDDTARRFGRGSRSWVFGTDERFRLWVELGDLLVQAGRFRDAAARFEQGWQRFPDNPIPLYLSGKALAKAGDAAAGKRRVEQSHWVGLGNARVRGRFLEELIARGDTAAVRRERDLVREAGWLSELFIGNVWNQVTRASVLLKDFDGAAAANRRAVHYLLRTPGVSYVEGFAYLTVPQAVSVYAARGLMAAGKPAEAVAAAKNCMAVLPGSSELASGLVPPLDKAGKAADADALFRPVWDAYTGVIAANPDSAWARHAAAWLAAGCRRELDAALAHAEKAVELDPDVRPYREALAEVRFRRGDRAGAVAEMRALSAADTRSHHYRRQLDRYQTAAFDSPLPDGDEE